jgi:hypothetical protein
VTGLPCSGEEIWAEAVRHSLSAVADPKLAKHAPGVRFDGVLGEKHIPARCRPAARKYLSLLVKRWGGSRAAIAAALGELSARTAAIARTAATARATAIELLNDPTVATLRQLDERRPLDLHQSTHPGTLGTVAGPPDAQPRIGPTSLVRTPIQDGANQFTDNSPRPLTDAAHTSAHSRAGDAATATATALPATAPTAAAATLTAARGSLISRAMAGED